MRATELAVGLDHSEGVCWDPAAGVLYAGGELGQLYSRLARRRGRGGRAAAEVRARARASTGAARVVACCQDAGVWRWDGDVGDAGRRRLRVRELPGVRAGRDALRLRLGRAGARTTDASARTTRCSRATRRTSRTGSRSRRTAAGSGSRSRSCRASGRIDLASGALRGGRAARRHRSRRARASTTPAACSSRCYRPDRIYHLERGRRADDRRRGSAGHAARRADERLLRGRRSSTGSWSRTSAAGTSRQSTTPACAARRCTGREGAAASRSAGSTSPRRAFGDRQIAWLSRPRRRRRGTATGRRRGAAASSRRAASTTSARASEGIGLHGTYSSLPARRRRGGDDRRPARPARRAHDRDRPTAGCGSSTAPRTSPTIALEAPLLYHVNLGDWARARRERRRRRSSRATTTPRRTTLASCRRPADEPERVWEHVGATWARVARQRASSSRSARTCRGCGSGSTRALGGAQRSSRRTARCSAARTTAPRDGSRCSRRARRARLGSTITAKETR